ncbi:uncharacterized protein LOC114467802 [Gouania willdenowi]|uniref:uncharacterized protein LOC114467802 n=1 Tax=Gouania willdenowi TaxID=441366 RepID=UPI0010556F33|nr:uncharacterized protein LOC114467802 [Gouania willdenowi]
MFTGHPGEERPGVCFLARRRELLPGEGVTAPPGAPLEAMDVSPQDPPLVAMDLSKRYNNQTRNRPEALDLAMKPEWYHRRPPSCSAELTTSSNSLSSDPEPHSGGGCMNSTLLPRLDLYHNDVHTNMWHSGFYGPHQSGGGPAPESSGGEDSDSGSDVIFLVSTTKEPLLCGSFIQEDMRHIVAPLSPTASSLDEDAACYRIPQPLSSPSPPSSYSEESSDSSLEIPAHHSRPLVLLSDLGTLYRHTVESTVEVSSDDSDVISVVDRKTQELPSRWCERKERSKASQRKVRRSSRKVTTPGAVARDSLKRRAKTNAVGIYNESCDSDDMMELAMRVSSSDESLRRSKRSLEVRSDRTPLEDQQQLHPTEDTPPIAPKVKRQRRTKQDGAPTNQRRQQNQNSPKSRSAPTRKKPTPRRRRKRPPCNGPSALFSPREPEINLKVLRIKEEEKKKEKKKKSGSFCPFVRVERRTCTVFNFQEEEDEANRSRGTQRAEPASRSTTSDFVPNTSCYRLGRAPPDLSCSATLRCRLCGQTANTTNLGDLHGPYRPDGPQELCPRPQGTPSHSADRSCSPTGTPPPDESWVHEDCSVWCAGVFLVRGRLYGLQEAALLAQEAVCSSCHKTGAIIGCFQKGCSRSYHLQCAISQAASS